MSYEEAREAHKNSGPYKSAYDAIKSPTFSKMHNERKKETREYRKSHAAKKSLEKAKGETKSKWSPWHPNPKVKPHSEKLKDYVG